MLRNSLSVGFLSALAFISVPAPAQPAPLNSGQYMARLQLLSRNEEKTLDACLVVSESGEFRRELRAVSPTVLESGSPGAKVRVPSSEVVDVFEGKLSDDELIRFRELLDKPNVRDIPSTLKNADRHFLKDEVFVLVVRRDNEYQRLMFFDKKSRASYEQGLVPIIKWFKTMQKHPAKKLSGSLTDRCSGEAPVP